MPEPLSTDVPLPGPVEHQPTKFELTKDAVLDQRDVVELGGLQKVQFSLHNVGKVVDKNYDCQVNSLRNKRSNLHSISRGSNAPNLGPNKSERKSTAKFLIYRMLRFDLGHRN